MSSRFHNKYHKHNHHSSPNNDPRYPDSAHDPIASQDSPFQGDFILHGGLSASVPSISAYVAALYGNVGINTSNPNTALTVNGIISATSYSGGNVPIWNTTSAVVSSLSYSDWNNTHTTVNSHSATWENGGRIGLIQVFNTTSIIVTGDNNITNISLSNINTIPSDPSSYIVSINGILQVPTTNYYISGSNFIFTSPLSTNQTANIIIFDILHIDNIPYIFNVSTKAINTLSGSNTASGYYSNVTGGISNTASGCISNVSGWGNIASGNISNIAGGQGNCATNRLTHIGGGFSNIASGYMSSVLGGCWNISSGDYSNVTGGRCNIASGNYSSILGGGNNNTNGFTNTFVLGSNLNAAQSNYTYVNNLSSQGSIYANLGLINSSGRTSFGHDGVGNHWFKSTDNNGESILNSGIGYGFHSNGLNIDSHTWALSGYDKMILDNNGLHASIIATGSITSRTLQDRFADIVNVKDFGAVGDGITDDTVAIQNSINSVSSGQYIELFFPKGIYNISGTVINNGRIISWKRDVQSHFIGSGIINGVYISPEVTDSYYWNQFALRTNDRIFSGPALSANDGLMVNNTSFDWLDTEIGFTSRSGQIVALSQAGTLGIVGGSRTSDISPIISGVMESTMGIGGFVINDQRNTLAPDLSSYAFGPSAYGLYTEARRKGEAGWTHAFEADAISRLNPDQKGSHPSVNLINTPLLTPPNPINGPALTGGWFSCGRPDINDCGDASVGAAFINNAGIRTSSAGRFKVGILFDQKSILGADGTNFAYSNNLGQAIALGTGHVMGWWNQYSITTPKDYITSSNSSSTNGLVIDLATSGLSISASGGEMLVNISKITNSDGYINLLPASSSNAAYIQIISPTNQTRNIVIGASNNGNVYLQNDINTLFTAGRQDASTNRLYSFGTTSNGALLGSSDNNTGINVDLLLSPQLGGSIRPAIDNNNTLGTSSYAWSNIFSHNALTVVSDIRKKTDIIDSNLGLDFINSLHPVSYRFKEGGKKVLSIDKDGIATKVASVSGTRTHFGLISQEVKDAIPTGIDFGGWILTDINNPNSDQALRYEEFISPMIKAIQELSTTVNTLSSRIISLETENNILSNKIATLSSK